MLSQYFAGFSITIISVRFYKWKISVFFSFMVLFTLYLMNRFVDKKLVLKIECRGCHIFFAFLSLTCFFSIRVTRRNCKARPDPQLNSRKSFWSIWRNFGMKINSNFDYFADGIDVESTSILKGVTGQMAATELYVFPPICCSFRFRRHWHSSLTSFLAHNYEVQQLSIQQL